MRAKEFIIEALSSEQRVKLFMALGKDFDRNIHDNIFKGKDRLYIPLEGSAEATPTPDEMSPTAHAIQAALNQTGYEIADYKAGLAAKKGDPTRKIKIGKVIKDQALLNQFARDPVRAATRQAQAGLTVAISRDPEDVAGMSTNRGWTSCMDLDGGINAHYVPHEVKNGAIIAYLIKPDDINIDRPLARILLKVYMYGNNANNMHMILVPDKLYGTAPNSFMGIVKKFCKWANSGSPSGMYKLSHGSYEDEVPNRQMHSPTDEYDLSKLDRDDTLVLARSDGLPGNIAQQLVSSKDPEVREALGYNSNCPESVLVQLSNDRLDPIRLAVASNKNLPLHLIAKLGRDSSPQVRAEIADNSKVDIDTLRRLAQDSSLEVKINVASNKNLTYDIGMILLNDKTSGTTIAVDVIASKSGDEQLLYNIIRQGNDSCIHTMARENPLLPLSIQRMLAKNSDEDIRQALAENKKIDIEIVSILARDKDPFVRWELVRSNASKLTRDQFIKLIGDPDDRVKYTATNAFPKYYRG